MKNATNLPHIYWSAALTQDERHTGSKGRTEKHIVTSI